jgi:hypothetical protein
MDNKLPNFPVDTQKYIAPSNSQVFSAKGNKKPFNLKWILVVIVVFLMLTLPVGTYFLGKQQGEAVKTARLAQDMTSLGTVPVAITPTPIPVLIPPPIATPIATNSGTLTASGSGILTATGSSVFTASNSAH